MRKKIVYFSCEDGKDKNPSLTITVCHQTASVVMPIGDLRDGSFYPILTLEVFL